MDEVRRNELILSLKNEIHEDPRLAAYSDQELRGIIEKRIAERGTALSFMDRPFVINGVFEAIRGFGILGEIIEDTDITEVMINGYDTVFIEKAGAQIRLNKAFESTDELSRIITQFVKKAGRSVSESNPIVDTRLPDGSRVNVVMPPVALNGPIVTIRRFPKVPMTIDKLIQIGSITPRVAEVLEMLVRARYNIFVSGGTGSGKTTFLNALSNYIPKSERIITIEDSAELQIKSIPNIVRLETKVTTDENAKPISVQDLIKSSLRMRPDRIVVGEVRGEEAIDMLQAMNTGHDGSLSTGHANSAKDMLSRLETMVLRGAELPLPAIRQQIGSAVDIIIQLARLRDHTRKTVEITEVTGFNHETGQIELNPLYKFVESEKTSLEKVDGVLTRTGNPMINKEKLTNAGIYTEI